ncbi:MAG: RDD family protein [Treponema sp.]|nr:RDD family protein [Treponema sp.]
MMSEFEHTGKDSSLGVQTPEGIEFALYPAGFLIRACAWAIDAFIHGALILAVLITAEVSQRALGIWVSLILIFILNWFYHTAFEVFGRGQSPGKRLMGIRVVRSDGSPVNPGASFLRNLLRFADAFMFLYLIALVCMLVSPAFRRFGDWVADTLVVYTATARSPGRFTSPALRRPGMPWLADIPMVYPARKLGYEEKQAILSFARRYPLLGEARANEIAGIWADTLKSPAPGLRFAPDRPQADPQAPQTGASSSAYLLGLAHTLDG